MKGVCCQFITLCLSELTRSLIMKKPSIFKKGISFVISSALSVSVLAAYPSVSGLNGKKVSAESIAEMQESINENKRSIAELEEQLSALEGNKAEEEQYQAVLSEQISKIEENLMKLENLIMQINSEIATAEFNIEMLTNSIKNQQDEIDSNVELFKQRLCNMYISGNDNLASVMVGNSSFYDILSRVEMMNRIAAYDEQLIDDILEDIDNMEQSKKELESERLTLQMKNEEQKKRADEKEAEKAALYEKLQESQAELDRINAEKQRIEGNKAELEALNAAYDQEIADIIAREQAEAQRRNEEEQARLAQQRAAAIQNGDYSYQPAVYSPTVSAEGFAWPAPGFCYISSPFGQRWGTLHGGIDIGDAGIHYGAACASRAGTVIYVYNGCTHDYPKDGSCGCGGGYGNYVIIYHDETFSTVYGHLYTACVSQGDYVQQGQQIGQIGTTGWSTGPHLHFEVRVNGQRVNPLNYVSP